MLNLFQYNWNSIYLNLKNVVTVKNNHQCNHFPLKYVQFQDSCPGKTLVMHLNSCLSHLSSTAYSEVMKFCCTCYFQRSHLLYDRQGEEHYNIISAMHKSIRASDDNAALYWVARMLKGGEDPLYIARRLVRAASEDIGTFVLCVTRNSF